MFELYIYITLIFMSILLALKNFKSSSTYIFLMLVLYSIVVRFTGYDDDIVNYASTLDSPLLLFFANIYYLKEWFYWIGSKLIYTVLPIKQLVFIIYDLLVFFFVFKGTKNMNLPKYFILLYFLFFPSLLGMQNVFRQFIAGSILFYSISLAYSNPLSNKKYYLWLLACCTHNLSFLFLPVIFSFSDKKRDLLFMICCALGVIVLLPVAAGSKSSSSTGMNLTSLYLIVVVVVFLFYLLSLKLKIRKNMFPIIRMSIYFVFLEGAAWKFLGSAQAERIGMMMFQMSLPFIVMFIDKYYKDKNFLRIALIIILILPTFLVGNVLEVLLTSLK